MQPLSSSEDFVQRLVAAEFEKDVHVVVVFKEMVEANYMLMFERSVDFDLTQKLNMTVKISSFENYPSRL